MNWDVMGGVARRNWARNPNAMTVAAQYNQNNDNGDQITLPFLVDGKSVDKAVDQLFPTKGSS
jgi:urocanate hydratase